MTAPFDSGLQLERTLLAWRRTCLALAVGIAIAVRYGHPLTPPDSLWVGLPALAAVAVAYLSVSRRYQGAHRALMASPSSLPTGGRAAAAVTLVSLALGVTAAATVLLGAADL